mmetsp:Transcript_49861/g.145005  ORF Transcript_49861/g.145005 Transcript_49861/m.145005 type:complete len:536 (+) Transcript_49861:589-2196(+)
MAVGDGDLDAADQVRPRTPVVLVRLRHLAVCGADGQRAMEVLRDLATPARQVRDGHGAVALVLDGGLLRLVPAGRVAIVSDLQPFLVLKEVDHDVAVEFEDCHGDLVLVVVPGLLHDAEELIDRSGRDAFAIRVAEHRVRLAGARLAVGEDADVVAVEHRRREGLGLLEDARLRGVRVEDLVELEPLPPVVPGVVNADVGVVLELHRRLGGVLRRKLLGVDGPHPDEYADVALEIENEVVQLLPILDRGLVLGLHQLGLFTEALHGLQRLRKVSGEGLLRRLRLGLRLPLALPELLRGPGEIPQLRPQSAVHRLQLRQAFGDQPVRLLGPLGLSAELVELLLQRESLAVGCGYGLVLPAVLGRVGVGMRLALGVGQLRLQLLHAALQGAVLPHGLRLGLGGALLRAARGLGARALGAKRALEAGTLGLQLVEALLKLPQRKFSLLRFFDLRRHLLLSLRQLCGLCGHRLGAALHRLDRRGFQHLLHLRGTGALREQRLRELRADDALPQGALQLQDTSAQGGRLGVVDRRRQHAR